MKVPEINPISYHTVMLQLISFFSNRGVILSYPTPGDILDACEDPLTIVKKVVASKTIPDKQTGQMGLEKLFFKFRELTKSKQIKGYSCITESTRNEPNPEDRHYHMFPMYEVEIAGDMEELYSVVSELLQFFGFDAPVRVDYEEACKILGVDIIGSKEELELYKIYGHSIALQYFPERTSPFWNMKREGEKAKKIDFLLFGVEVIGSAERETDKQIMIDRFFNISKGLYAGKLVADFGLVPTIQSLFTYLEMVEEEDTRSGFGMGVVRFIEALIKLEELKMAPQVDIQATAEPNF